MSCGCENCDENGIPRGVDGTDGEQGEQGDSGANGTNGTSVAFTVTVIPNDGSDIECPCGGWIISLGPDANNDGVPDSFTSIFRICDGCEGEDAIDPVGVVKMFVGNSTLGGPNFDATGLGIADLLGYALANGSNGTVDLRAKFVVGLYPGGDSDGDYATIGSIGGEKKHTLITAELSAHTHASGTLTTNTVAAHSHGINWGNDAGNGSLVDGTNVNPTTAVQTQAAGAHSHSVNSGNTASTGAGIPHENRPPYYTVSFIQRI